MKLSVNISRLCSAVPWPQVTGEDLTLLASHKSLHLDYAALALLQWCDGSGGGLLHSAAGALCYTCLYTGDVCVCVLCRDSDCWSVFIFLPSLAPRAGANIPSLTFCSPVWQGFLLLASQSLRVASSAQKCTWRHIPACALASLPSENIEEKKEKSAMEINLWKRGKGDEANPARSQRSSEMCFL